MIFFNFSLVNRKSILLVKVLYRKLIIVVKNRVCPLSNINAVQLNVHITASRRYQKLFTHEEVMKSIRPSIHQQKLVMCQCCMKHSMNLQCSERSFCLIVQEETTLLSFVLIGRSLKDVYHLKSFTLEKKKYCFVCGFVRHNIVYDSKKVAHIFSRVHWFKSHPKENWFNHHLAVIDSDLQNSGPVTFMRESRVFGQCAIVANKIKFDYGYHITFLYKMCLFIYINEFTKKNVITRSFT